ncbi:armadillo-type protein [Mycena metata]|uniref:Armadillo-type protein n=1 Tax=Mycena metata TaxID=1033252 RepID=A0AAD7JC81_9AGAR|nr:armadillo-type protein [Mycena metata]
MPPLQRQRTRESLLSWWSDSNSVGATIPLHTFAKPLSKLLHNRQASGLVRKYRNSPLSKESLGVFSAYLVLDLYFLFSQRELIVSSFKGISSATRSAVLEDLIRRTQQETEARAFAEANILPFLMELLETREENILRGTCRLLRIIASWPSLIHDFQYLDLRPLFILLRHSDTVIRQDALYTWARVVSPEILLDLVNRLLESPDVDVVMSKCKLLQDTFKHQSALQISTSSVEMLSLKLVTFLNHEDVRVQSGISDALVTLVYPWAQAVGADNFLCLAQKLLESSWDNSIIQWTCQLLEDAFEHQSAFQISASSVEMLSSKLLTFLNHENGPVKTSASLALKRLARHPNPDVKSGAMNTLTKFMNLQIAEIMMKIVSPADRIGLLGLLSSTDRFHLWQKRPELHWAIYGQIPQIPQVPGQNHDTAFEGDMLPAENESTVADVPDNGIFTIHDRIPSITVSDYTGTRVILESPTGIPSITVTEAT